ncbi:15979_t:CDS:2 [Funneliformis geosporum]|uniref:5865_t:CDS:1 n=1 Tax=Funneliformis geosporum TaxID=1117311 RepID=A0A9W4SVQ8_9GLOM|nr:5865_t:CDS:2 [Funneliformis geosporum]CAI2182872.1 15979_t:CDS:2 [Funneliformis geosporum]
MLPKQDELPSYGIYGIVMDEDAATKAELEVNLNRINEIHAQMRVFHAISAIFTELEQKIRRLEEGKRGGRRVKKWKVKELNDDVEVDVDVVTEEP